MKLMRFAFLFAATLLALDSCKKNTPVASQPSLIFKFVFDSTQVRLDNLGNPSTIAAGHGAQSPQMNVMAAHYIELAANNFVQLGQGVILYQTPMTTAGGASAIDFSQEKQIANGDTFFSVPLKNVTPGTYQYLRVSLAYQNYTVQMYVDSIFNYGGYTDSVNQLFPSTIASFVGVDSYVGSLKIKDSTVAVNGNRMQGFWGFETEMNFVFAGQNFPYTVVETGQAPDSATTVVNPLFATSPIPSGSCVVTAAFDSVNGTAAPLRITGNETENIVVTVSLSINKSFEWQEVKQDGLWEPLRGENIVDMGIRGMIPYVKY
jgi:hypothetical protein